MRDGYELECLRWITVCFDKHVCSEVELYKSEPGKWPEAKTYEIDDELIPSRNGEGSQRRRREQSDTIRKECAANSVQDKDEPLTSIFSKLKSTKERTYQESEAHKSIRERDSKDHNNNGG